MPDCNFNNIENTLLMTIASLMINREAYNNIIDFVDSSKDKNLKDNEFVVRTKQGNYKINIEAYSKCNIG